MDETLRALDDLVRQGKVRYIGISNHSAWQVADAQWLARQHRLNGFVSCQDEYSLLVRGGARGDPGLRGSVSACCRTFPWPRACSPASTARGAVLPADARFASKSMGGLGNRYITEGNSPIVERLRWFRAAAAASMLELAFSWLAANPTVAA